MGLPNLYILKIKFYVYIRTQKHFTNKAAASIMGILFYTTKEYFTFDDSPQHYIWCEYTGQFLGETQSQSAKKKKNRTHLTVRACKRHMLSRQKYCNVVNGRLQSTRLSRSFFSWALCLCFSTFDSAIFGGCESTLPLAPSGLLYGRFLTPPESMARPISTSLRRLT